MFVQSSATSVMGIHIVHKMFKSCLFSLSLWSVHPSEPMKHFPCFRKTCYKSLGKTFPLHPPKFLMSFFSHCPFPRLLISYYTLLFPAFLFNFPPIFLNSPYIFKMFLCSLYVYTKLSFPYQNVIFP